MGNIFIVLLTLLGVCTSGETTLPLTVKEHSRNAKHYVPEVVNRS